MNPGSSGLQQWMQQFSDPQAQKAQQTNLADLRKQPANPTSQANPGLSQPNAREKQLEQQLSIVKSAYKQLSQAYNEQNNQYLLQMREGQSLQKKFDHSVARMNELIREKQAIMKELTLSKNELNQQIQVLQSKLETKNEGTSASDEELKEKYMEVSTKYKILKMEYNHLRSQYDSCDRLKYEKRIEELTKKMQILQEEKVQEYDIMLKKNDQLSETNQSLLKQIEHLKSLLYKPSSRESSEDPDIIMKSRKKAPRATPWTSKVDSIKNTINQARNDIYKDVDRLTKLETINSVLADENLPPLPPEPPKTPLFVFPKFVESKKEKILAQEKKSHESRAKKRLFDIQSPQTIEMIPTGLATAKKRPFQEISQSRNEAIQNTHKNSKKPTVSHNEDPSETRRKRMKLNNHPLLKAHLGDMANLLGHQNVSQQNEGAQSRETQIRGAARHPPPPPAAALRQSKRASIGQSIPETKPITQRVSVPVSMTAAAPANTTNSTSSRGFHFGSQNVRSELESHVPSSTNATHGTAPALKPVNEEKMATETSGDSILERSVSTELDMMRADILAEADLRDQIQCCLDMLGKASGEEWQTRNFLLEMIGGLVDESKTVNEKQLWAARLLFKQQLMDLRSAVVKTACHTLTVVSKAIGAKYGQLFAYLIPVHLKGLCVTISVISEAHRNALHQCVQNTRSLRAMKPLLHHATDKHKSVRYEVLTLLSRMVSDIGKSGGAGLKRLEKHVTGIANAMTDNASDSNNDVRRAVRELFHVYNQHLSKHLSKLKPTVQALLKA